MTAAPSRPAEGLTIAIIAPSGAADADLVGLGVRTLEARGARVLVHEQVLQSWGYFAGTDEMRVAAIEDVMHDPRIDVVMAARGGYGAVRIIDGIDWEGVARSRKIWCGFSDFTAFNWAALACGNFVTLHGPMLTSDFARTPDPFMEASFWPLLRGQAVTLDITDPDAKAIRPLQGPVWGGNLSVLSRLIGTAYEPSMTGGLLFLEDINEEPYALERMFIQLVHTGILERQSAIILCDFTACEARNPQRYAYSLAEAVTTLRAISPIPVLSQFPFGHVARKASLPFGTTGRIEVGDGGYRVVLQLATS
jgi:muramoyltetrapeptide carboxypeptidase